MQRIYTTAGASGVPVHFVIPSAPVSVMKMTSSWRIPSFLFHGGRGRSVRHPGGAVEDRWHDRTWQGRV